MVYDFTICCLLEMTERFEDAGNPYAELDLSMEVVP